MKGFVETQCARSGDAHIAYQIVGDASLDLVLLPGAFSHVEHQWEEPSFARLPHRLASFSRLIVLDVRGTGLSDRAADLPTLEEQIDDVLAVLDAVRSERAVLFGLSQGGGLASLFAAAHPARTSALVLFGAYARAIWADDFPWGRTPEEYDKLMRLADEGWGGGVFLPLVAPSVACTARSRTGCWPRSCSRTSWALRRASPSSATGHGAVARNVTTPSSAESWSAALALDIRSGLHTGEVELVGDDVRGIAVHIGARTAALAGPGEVLVTSTVKDLVAGSDNEFEDRGVRALKSVPGTWRVFRVSSA